MKFWQQRRVRKVKVFTASMWFCLAVGGHTHTIIPGSAAIQAWDLCANLSSINKLISTSYNLADCCKYSPRVTQVLNVSSVDLLFARFVCISCGNTASDFEQCFKAYTSQASCQRAGRFQRQNSTLNWSRVSTGSQQHPADTQCSVWSIGIDFMSRLRSIASIHCGSIEAFISKCCCCRCSVRLESWLETGASGVSMARSLQLSHVSTCTHCPSYRTEWSLNPDGMLNYYVRTTIHDDAFRRTTHGVVNSSQTTRRPRWRWSIWLWSWTRSSSIKIFAFVGPRSCLSVIQSSSTNLSSQWLSDRGQAASSLLLLLICVHEGPPNDTRWTEMSA